MKRLFWKFFIGLFLAQIVTIGIVVSLYWFKDGPHVHQSPMVASQNVPIAIPEETQSIHHRTPRLPYRPLIAGLFTSLVFAYVLARNLAKPIEYLRKGFDEVSRGNFNYKVAPLLKGRHDELATLGRHFDLTADKLQQLLTSQKRLLHDVSHELRSPLARMQIAIDLLECSPERTADLVVRLGRETERLNNLVSSILTLAKLESSDIWKLDDKVNLKDLIEDVISDVTFEAAAKNIRVHLAYSNENYLIKGNQELLHRAIENVLRNAITFSPPNEQVHVTIEQHKDKCEVSVTDHGPSIASEDLHRIFDPFQRGSSSDSASGYGLGLAIAKQTLKLHGGSITARNLADLTDQKGLRVTLIL